MTIDSFFTQQTLTAIPGASGANGGKAVPAGQSPAAAFLDVMLLSLLQTKEVLPEEGASAKETKNPLLSKEITLGADPNAEKLSIATLIAADSETREMVEDFVLPTLAGDEDGELEAIEQTLALNQKVFDEILKPLADKGVLSQDTLDKIQELKISKLQAQNAETTEILSKEIMVSLLGDLEELSAKGRAIVSNLTPEQMTALQNKISKSAPEAQDAVIVTTLIQLMMPVVKTGSANTAPVSTPVPAIAGDGQKENRATATFTPLTPANTNIAAAPQAQSSALPLAGEGENAPPESFEDIAQRLIAPGTNKQTPQAENAAPAQSNSVKPQGVTHVLPTLPSLLGLDASALAAFPDSLQFTPSGESASLASLNLSGLSSFANALAHGGTNAAASASPAGAQIIAATLQKMGADGKDKLLTLQLDPPELGRVEIKMSFGKDKAMKTVLTVEKPETLALLQKDSHALERAMNEIGLDNAESLSFELAQDGHDFNQNGSHDGSRNAYKTPGGDESEMEMIQTTMTWHVDPATGHMRYDILA